jgi:hypothetical protein
MRSGSGRKVFQARTLKNNTASSISHAASVKSDAAGFLGMPHPQKCPARYAGALNADAPYTNRAPSCPPDFFGSFSFFFRFVG